MRRDTCADTFDKIEQLHQTGMIGMLAIIELNRKAKESEYDINRYPNLAKLLKKNGLLNDDDSLPAIVQQVVSFCLAGESLDLTLKSKQEVIQNIQNTIDANATALGPATNTRFPFLAEVMSQAGLEKGEDGQYKSNRCAPSLT